MRAASNPEPLPYNELVTFDCRVCGKENQYGIAVANGGPLVIRCDCGRGVENIVTDGATSVDQRTSNEAT